MPPNALPPSIHARGQVVEPAGPSVVLPSPLRGRGAGGERDSPSPPRLLDRVRAACRVRHYSLRTEQCYVHWIRRFVWFHGLRHPQEMGAAEINAFLTYLAVGNSPAPRAKERPGEGGLRTLPLPAAGEGWGVGALAPRRKTRPSPPCCSSIKKCSKSSPAGSKA